MKKVIALFGVMLFSVAAFALNAVGQDCNERRAKFEKDLAIMRYQPAGIIQYVLINMAEPMGGLSDAQIQDDAVCYATFRVQGTALVDFVRAHADVFRQRVPEEERGDKVLDQLQADALGFAARVERVSEQAILDEIASSYNKDWIVQHVLSNLADPMATMSDEQAAPKAAVYKQLKVRKQSLVNYVRQQAERFPGSVATDLNAFADRVDQLSQ